MLETSFVIHTCATNFLYAQWPELAIEHPLCCYEPNLFIVNGLSLVESSVSCYCVEDCRLHREEINGTWIPCIFKILVLHIMETLCNWNLELCFVYTQIWSCVLYTFKSGTACIYLALETDVYLALETNICCVHIPCVEELRGVLRPTINREDCVERKILIHVSPNPFCVRDLSVVSISASPSRYLGGYQSLSYIVISPLIRLWR